MATLQVDIWSDVVCPWCFIGKRRFERALAELDGEIEVELRFRPYQLDPTAEVGRTEPVADAYARKFGGPQRAAEMIERATEAAAGDGIEFHLERALRANTLLSHRLLWLAEQDGSPVAQPVVKERLMQAYFTDGLDIGDPETLADLAAEIGFDRADVVTFLAGDAGRAEIAEELELAASLGITAVPTFVIENRWAVPGAQDSATFVNVLRRIVEQSGAD